MDVLFAIKNSLISVVNQHDDDFWKNSLRDTYSQFFLIHNNEWQIETLKNSHNQLIPPNKHELVGFIEQLFNHLYHNPYLTSLFTTIGPTELKYIQDDHIPQILSFAYGLDKLNALMRNDLKLTKAIIDHLYIHRKKNNFYRLSNILRIIKFHSIQFPVLRFLKDHKKGNVSSSSGKYILAGNIFEAFLVDMFKGYFKNAFSCVPLMIFSPNFKGMFFFSKYFKRGSNSRISRDGKCLEMTSPSQKKWSDLYQSWNFTFVSQFPQASYLLVKLIIPSVTNYQNNPSSYMHTRITALLLCLNFVDLATNNCQLKHPIDQVPSFCKKTIQKQGILNYHSSLDYYDSVKLDKSE